jgi:hypothetical protein
MGTSTISSQDNKTLCEALGCFEQAITEVSVPVGDLGIIKVLVCGNCMSKFVGCDFVLKKRIDSRDD